MKRSLCLLQLLISLLLCNLEIDAQNNDVILQGFYWNVNPGNVGDNINGGIWWDSLTSITDELADAGFGTIWVPNPTKSAGGMYDMGYAPFDYYDLGDYDQNFAVRTRFGKKSEFLNLVNSAHNNGLKILADIVLNHRGGAQGQEPFQCGGALGWTTFNPASGRFPGIARHFHPNNTHCDQTPDYHDPLFFEDLCYFNNGDAVLDATLPNNGWYYGSHNLGEVGDSLIIWMRWLLDETNIDALRLDAIKHIEPGFIAPFLAEINNGPQPFAFGEFFDGNPGIVKSYHDQVEAYNTSFSTGTKNANLAMNDFSLRFKLAEICNNATGSSNLSDLNTIGQLFGSGMDPNDIVTFVDNHDFDRIGYTVTGGAPCGSGQIQVGSTCLELFTDDGHAPVSNDKHMAYAYILQAEGNPTVFWKDYFWYGLGKEIKWMIALRNDLAGGNSTPISGLAPFYSTGYNGGDLHVLNRNGGGGNPGSMLVLNDKTGSGSGNVWVNSPFTNTELRDYSDSYLFTTKRAFGDSRANVQADTRNYAVYAPTGYYPVPSGDAPSAFTLDAGTGARLHHIALTTDNLSNYQINGSPIQPGDQIAIIGSGGNPQLVAGIGRTGQSLEWKGSHDMIIEVLGGTNAAEANGGLLDGNALQLVVFDASENQYYTAGGITFSPANTTFTFDPLRPGSKGGSFAVTTTDGSGQYEADAISLITGFSAGCGSPGPISSNVVGAASIQLVWNAVPDAQGYEILGKTLAATSFVTLTIANPATSSLTINNLNPTENYLWFMRTVCDAANGVYSDYTESEIFNIASQNNCPAPSANSTSNVTATSAQLNWFFVPDAVGYVIKGRPVGSGITVTLSVSNPSITTFQVNNLASATSYEWQVQTICASGLGSLFTPLNTFTTLGSNKIGREVSETYQEQSLFIAPNPFKEFTTVTIPQNIHADAQVQWSMFDMSGKLIRTDRFAGSTFRIDRVNLQPGVYLIEVQGSSTYREKLIVQ